MQQKTATTADARFAVQDAHDIRLNKNAKFVNYFFTNVIVAIVGIPSVPKSYHLTMNTIVIYVGQCVRNVLVQNSSVGPESHIAKYVVMECITVELIILQMRAGDIMAKCYVYDCQNQAPKDCDMGRCALHCTAAYCERHPKDEEDLPEPDNTDYLGEDSDCIDDRSDDDCGAKNGRVFHGEHNTITCSVCRIIIEGPSADYAPTGDYPDTGEPEDDWSDVPYFD